MSKQQVYLSIDLDFWCGNAKFPTELFDNIAKLPVPKVVVLSHEHMVQHINQLTKQFTTLVNVDYHSDLAGTDCSEQDPITLDEGTWANFVKESKSKMFIWSPPHRACVSPEHGYCHGDYKNPFRHGPAISGWGKTSIRIGHFPKLDRCIGIGVSLSTYWTSPSILHDFAHWHKDHPGVFDIRPGAKHPLKVALTL